ncbi:MAG: hypothetical protein ABL985_15765 [Casimicrobium sp.]
MQPKLSSIVLATLVLGTSSTSAQDTPSKPECSPPRSTQPRPSTLVPRPEVNVLCGANSITQTYPAEIGAKGTIPSASKKQEDSSPAFSLLIALITGAAGVLGALAGALASYLVARAKAKSDMELETKRLAANVVAAERLRWLQDIRQRLSTLFQQLDFQYNVLKRPVTAGSAPATQQQLDRMSNEVMEQCNMITLMLNPAKPDQAALRDSLQGSLRFVQEVFQQSSTGARTFDDIKYATYKQAAFDAMTRIGVQTWKQVKSLA